MKRVFSNHLVGGFFNNKYMMILALCLRSFVNFTFSGSNTTKWTIWKLWLCGRHTRYHGVSRRHSLKSNYLYYGQQEFGKGRWQWFSYHYSTECMRFRTFLTMLATHGIQPCMTFVQLQTKFYYRCMNMHLRPLIHCNAMYNKYFEFFIKMVMKVQTLVMLRSQVIRITFYHTHNISINEVHTTNNNSTGPYNRRNQWNFWRIFWGCQKAAWKTHP